MLTRIYFFIYLFVFMFFLSGYAGFMHFISLIGIALITVLIKTYFLKLEWKNFIKLKSQIKYLAWLCAEIVKSSIIVTKIIWFQGKKVNPKIISVKTNFRQDQLLQVITANSITLTPGTYTIDSKAGELIIHTLTLDNIREFASFAMQDKVAALRN